MGLQADMDMPPLRAGVVQRSLQRVGATRIGSALLGAIVGPIDRLVYRLSHGRTTATRALGGFPTVMLTTTGARSGQPRTVPMNVIPYRSNLALVGSYYGKGITPAWVYNLRKTPAASIAFARRDHPVLATEVNGAEYDEIFSVAAGIYPGYARYRRDASGPIPVFVLTAREDR